MEIIYLFFIAFINSIDNLGIGVAYSIAGVKINLSKNLLISFLAFIVSFISSLSGGFIAHYLNEEASTIVGALILILMGARMIYEFFLENDVNKHKVIKILKYKEAILVGTVLALDDIGSSVSSGLIGYKAFMVSFPYFIISFLIFFLANYGTEFFKKLKIGKKATAISGSIMILLGVLQLFD